LANDEDLWQDIEELELILKEPKTFGIYPETEEGRRRYAELEKEHEKLLKEFNEKYIEDQNCSECGSSDVYDWFEDDCHFFKCNNCGSMWDN